MAPDMHKKDSFPFFKQEPKIYEAPSRLDRKINTSPRLLSPELEIASLKYDQEAIHDRRATECLCLNCNQLRLQNISKEVAEIGGSMVYEESVPHGFEINMPIAGGDKFLSLISNMSDHLVENLAYVTEKCGTHLHIDATDFKNEDMVKFLWMYSFIEPALIWTQPAARVLKQEKPHCRPCGQRYQKSLIESERLGRDLRSTIQMAIYNTHGDHVSRPPRYERGNNRGLTTRYNFVNCHSWFFRGTIECRGHAGTIDAGKIQNWGMIWASLLDKAVSMNEREVRNLQGEDPKLLLLNLTPSQTHTYLVNRWEAFESQYKGKKL
jgi:hypothetical protein